MYHKIIITESNADNLSIEDLLSIEREIRSYFTLLSVQTGTHRFQKLCLKKFTIKCGNTLLLKECLSKLPFDIEVISPDFSSEKNFNGRVFYEDSGFFIKDSILTEKEEMYSTKEDALFIKDFWDTFHETQNI